jgi:hypothetical protein
MFVTIPKNLICRDYLRQEVTAGAAVLLKTVAAAKVLNATYGPCQAVRITVEDNSIRYRHDGGAPTTGATGNGAAMNIGDAAIIPGGANVRNLSMIGYSGTANVHIDFYYEK